MADRKDITERSDDAVRSFVDELRQAPSPGAAGGRGRLIFALDATASRKPTWDQACAVQGEMFLEADRLGGLDVQLVFYRGFEECKSSRWVGKAKDLVNLMVKVDCRAGRTQIHRVLRHAINETRKRRVHAVIFIGDACEEGHRHAGRPRRPARAPGCQGLRLPRGARPDGGLCVPGDRAPDRRCGLPLRRQRTGRAAGAAARRRGLCRRRPEGAHRLREARGRRRRACSSSRPAGAR